VLAIATDGEMPNATVNQSAERPCKSLLQRFCFAEKLPRHLHRDCHSRMSVSERSHETNFSVSTSSVGPLTLRNGTKDIYFEPARQRTPRMRPRCLPLLYPTCRGLTPNEFVQHPDAN
jgi:hypothetical protein